MSKIVITGGRGFIGSAVARLAKDRGHEPVVFDTADGCDVREFSEDDADGAEAVIHLAGVLGTAELFDDPDRAVDVNIRGSLRVIEACTEVGAHLVQITMPQCWSNVYQATKDCAGQLADALCDNRGLRLTHVRAYNAFGPGQKVHGVRKIVPTFATAAWRGDPIEVWGKGDQLVDLIHVDDLAGVLLDAVDHAAGDGGTIDAGTGTGHTVREVAEFIADQAGAPRSSIVFSPMRAGETLRRVRPDLRPPRPTIAAGEGWDIDGIERPSFRPGALAATVEWYREDRP